MILKAGEAFTDKYDGQTIVGVVQPTGSWISDYDNNVWEPGVYGWDEV